VIFEVEVATKVVTFFGEVVTFDRGALKTLKRVKTLKRGNLANPRLTAPVP
jgi:hypothetical protein